MELTGKCKEDFEKWFLINHYTEVNTITDKEKLSAFYSLHQSMQYGVYVDYFDSVGVFANDYHIEIAFRYMIDIKEDTYMSTDFETRPEARTQAIIKANEIYNEKDND